VSFYDSLRDFADSYALAAMVIVFVALCLWPFRPGSKDRNSAAAHSIFKDNGDGE
jgi:cytochrome c oxidase cbb3-type subunit 4